MKFSRQTLINRMLKRFLIYGLGIGIIFVAMFYFYQNTLPGNFDVLLFLIGMSTFLGAFIGIVALIWEATYGDEDPRIKKKDNEKLS